LHVNDGLDDIDDVNKKAKNGCVDLGNVVEIGDMEVDLELDEDEECEVEQEVATEENMKQLLKEEYEEKNCDKKEPTMGFDEFHNVLDEHIKEMKTMKGREEEPEEEEVEYNNGLTNSMPNLEPASMKGTTPKSTPKKKNLQKKKKKKKKEIS